MSYWITLNDEKGTVAVKPFSAGSTYNAISATGEACISVTWNYNKVYFDLLGCNLRNLIHGKKAKKTLKKLAYGAMMLGTNKSDDYWVPTPGNAGFILALLFTWAKEHPDAVWNVN